MNGWRGWAGVDHAGACGRERGGPDRSDPDRLEGRSPFRFRDPVEPLTVIRISSFVVAFGLVLTASVWAGDLSVDGQVRVEKQLRQPFTVDLRGPPGARVVLLVDLVGGPASLLGETVDIGLSPLSVVQPLGEIPAGGTLSFAAALPPSSKLVDRTLYAVAAVSSGGGWELSATLKVVVVERGTQLAGNALDGFPGFEYVRAFNESLPLTIAVDPAHHPQAVGRTADVYVVASKDAAQWDADPLLVDVSGDGADTVVFGATLADNLVTVDDGLLSGDAGDGLGVGYDVVVDFGRDGRLDPEDLIDGYGAEAGLYVCRDTTLAGPHAVTEALYSGGSFLGQDLYYPTDIASLGQLPLIVVSHGNGHDYQWYDHIGYHMASHGFVVMSHQNNTVPGIEAASTTTLTNTDYLLGNLDLIEGGALQGHVDGHRILWIGHSRGAEGVVRAYDRIFDGAWVPAHFDLDDIRLVSSMAPTDFLGSEKSTPHGVPYHLWVGGADADVSGCANNDIAQSFHLLGRAEDRRQSISLHGVGHGIFHDGSGGNFATGPCKVFNTAGHQIMRGYMLPLFLRHAAGNVPAEDYLWRQYERFHPLGAPVVNPCVVVDLQHRQADAEGRLVIDDFQTNGDPSVASTGEAVSLTVDAVSEGRLDDEDTAFTDAGQPFNGFTECRASDASRGLVFAFSGGSEQSIRFTLAEDARNGREWDALTFRAAQVTRHALTIAELDDVTFSVTLVDRMGRESTVDIGTFGGGIEEPYQRENCGTGAGWGNEFETVRLPLREFEAGGAGVDLSNLAAVSLRFGAGLGSTQGRLGLDDLAFARD